MTLVVGLNVKLWLDEILVLPNVMIEMSNVRRKKKSTTECDKSTPRNDVGTAQCNNGTAKFENKKQGTINVTKVELDVMLVLPIVTIEPSNLRKKINEPLNVTKELLNVMLELHNATM